MANLKRSKPTIAVTGLSGFSDQLIKMIEDDEHGVGGNPLPLYQSKLENMLAWVDAADGLVLAGGVDIHPSMYGEAVLSCRGLTKFDLARDERELEVIDHAVKAGKPILAICRGHQLFSLYLGLGDEFVADLSGEIVHSPPRHNISLARNEHCHDIRILDEEFAKEAEGLRSSAFPVAKRLLSVQPERNLAGVGWVNSYHHQGIRWHHSVAKKFNEKGARVLAFADTGGNNNNLKHVVELMQAQDEANWISVQWHPEIDYAENAWSKATVLRFRKMISAA